MQCVALRRRATPRGHRIGVNGPLQFKGQWSWRLVRSGEEGNRGERRGARIVLRDQ